MNAITLTGNLGKDAVLKQFQDDHVLSFSVADSRGKDSPTTWWNCQLRGKRAQSLEPYLTKGQQVTVVGSVSEREYADKETGQMRKVLVVSVNDVALQGGKRDASEQSAAPQRRAASPVPSKPTGSGFDDMDNDIPF